MTVFRWSLGVAAGCLIAVPALAQQDEAVRRDLAAVIQLQGLPCGQVVSYQQQNENDYIATCRSGDRYRIQLVGERVTVTPQ